VFFFFVVLERQHVFVWTLPDEGSFARTKVMKDAQIAGE